MFRNRPLLSTPSPPLPTPQLVARKKSYARMAHISKVIFPTMHQHPLTLLPRFTPARGGRIRPLYHQIWCSRARIYRRVACDLILASPSHNLRWHPGAPRAAMPWTGLSSRVAPWAGPAGQGGLLVYMYMSQHCPHGPPQGVELQAIVKISGKLLLLSMQEGWSRVERLLARVCWCCQ